MPRRRTKGPDADHYAWDGHFYAGWRSVRRGGYVMAAGDKFHHPKLLDLVGQKVWVRIMDYWCQELYVQMTRWGMGGHGIGFVATPMRSK